MQQQKKLLLHHAALTLFITQIPVAAHHRACRKGITRIDPGVFVLLTNLRLITVVLRPSGTVSYGNCMTFFKARRSHRIVQKPTGIVVCVRALHLFRTGIVVANTCLGIAFDAGSWWKANDKSRGTEKKSAREKKHTSRLK